MRRWRSMSHVTTIYYEVREMIMRRDFKVVTGMAWWNGSQQIVRNRIKLLAQRRRQRKKMLRLYF